MENKKEPLMSAEEYFNTKNFGTDFDFAQDYANYVTQWQQQQNKNLYSEEDMEQAFVQGASTDLFNTWNLSNEEIAKEKFKEWFNKNKKK